MARDVIGNYTPADISCSDEALDLFTTPPVNYYYDNVELQEIHPQLPLTPTTSNFTFLISPSEDFISLENIVLETKVKIELSSGDPLPPLNRTAALTTPAQSLSYASSQTPSLITTSSLSSRPSIGFDSLNRKRKRDDDDDDDDDEERTRKRQRQQQQQQQQLNRKRKRDDDVDGEECMRKKIKRQQQQQQQRQRQQQESSSWHELPRKRKRERDDVNDEERERKRIKIMEGRERRRKKKNHGSRCDSRLGYFSPHMPPPWDRYHDLTQSHPQPQPQPNPGPAPNPEVFLGCGFEQSPHYTIYKDISVVLNNEELAPMNGCYGKLFLFLFWLFCCCC